MPSTSRPSRTRDRVHDRLRIARTAARLMVESGERDLRHACRKAARQLGMDEPSLLPDDSQLQQALQDHLRLFAGPSQQDALQLRRQAAVNAMEFFQPFAPRLAGPVLEGSADAHSAVQLHLHTDEPEAVQRHLQDHHLPAHEGSTRLRLGAGSAQPQLSWHIDADGIAFELVVLPEQALRQPPSLPGADSPMPRASLAQLRQLLQSRHEP